MNEKTARQWLTKHEPNNPNPELAIATIVLRESIYKIVGEDLYDKVWPILFKYEKEIFHGNSIVHSTDSK